MKLFRISAKMNEHSFASEAASGITITVVALCILYKEAVTESVINNIRICFSVLVPSLFPMLIFSNVLNETGVPYPLRLFWKYGIERLFGLPEDTATASVIGFTSGYPLGIRNARRLYEQNLIRRNDAMVLALSCIHPGISFCILSVGVGFFGSPQIGFILYASVLAADLLLARIASFRYPRTYTNHPVNSRAKTDDLPSVLIRSVHESVTGILSIIAWILICGVLQTILIQTFPPSRRIISLTGEVTAASLYTAQQHSVLLCSFTLGFGGISLLLQVWQDLRAIGIRLLQYILCRLSAGLLSSFFCYLILKAFPQTIPVFNFNNGFTIRLSTDYVGTIALLTVCVIFMFDTHSNIKKYKKHEN